jgi:RDD family
MQSRIEPPASSYRLILECGRVLIADEPVNFGWPMSADSEALTRPVALYARFTRRVQGIMIDSIVVIVLIVCALSLAVAVQSDTLSRVLGFAIVAAALLYEPVLVSFTGSTLGHYVTNLRVVDDASGGNVSFLKACARLAIKSLLGWYSFVILAATRRNQAVHDLLTRSTVQIRDPAKARPAHYLVERSAALDRGMPSQSRRTGVIFAYLLVAIIGFVVIINVLVTTRALSLGCLNGNHCSGAETLIELIYGFALLALVAAIIALGWKGRLLGALKRS